ncbi:MAG: Panacea domain-containing protein [Sphingobium phenoxybenzoativorans]
MSAPYDATTVANRFIELAARDDKQLTPMQLIKLSYIAHGFSLAINRRPLLNESVEAWRYGPVVPSLYRKLKSYGSNGVSRPIAPFFSGLRTEQLDQEDRDLIDEVFAKYGKFSGTQLSHLTHRPGTPWAETYEPNVYGVDIDDAVIRTHYATLINR